MLTELTKQNFDEIITACPGTALVDFWAPGCGPCNILHQVLEVVAERHPNVTVATMNVAAYPDVAMAFEVMATPTLVMFENGVPVDAIAGAIPVTAVEAFLRHENPAIMME